MHRTCDHRRTRHTADYSPDPGWQPDGWDTRRSTITTPLAAGLATGRLW